MVNNQFILMGCSWILPGRDSWTLLSSALELLQWKTDISDSFKLLAPLSQALRFLLDKLRAMGGTASEEDDLELEASEILQGNARW